MPLLPGAEPYRHQGGRVGVLVCHGFTGSPQSMRPWAEAAAADGLSVSLPLLPGHGTQWRDLNVTRWPDWYATVEREFDVLAKECDQVFVFGLSMGGLLSLHLAAERGAAVSGLVLVNPLVRMPGQAHRALPLVRHLIPSLPGVSDDVALPGVSEQGYTRTPLHAAHSMAQLARIVQSELPQITQPLLLFRSTQDHVVPPPSGALLLSRISSTDVEERLLERSYHVATLDYDAETIFEGSLDFVRRLTTPAEV
ncbi:alpha/beta fold hydrolase [Streptacidiphilus sp. PB12-B1b]|uniref:alpha/beta hydrolase n=1 Tax=Streptacidiphilus sp. PB12-B1b TaxID=2705012 RepID=UPI0015FBD04C|nr:alpha/beta fold hydrolase [Streptacidiphilus sp. PB12-B1b]QMU75878.1 alpha/beta fold hydrolase [Streptacidiphilus sp. PB12-B1b]